MKSHLYHIQLNIDSSHLDFYKKFMDFMGWKIIFEGEGMAGFHSEKTGDLWFIGTSKNETGDYDARGVNHISLRVETKKDVDDVQKFLEGHSIKMLFDTPRHRSEFATSEKETYYQIMFESPDKILFEIVYIGLK